MSKVATFTVSLSAASTLPVSMAYTTVAETAASGVDYTATAGTLTFTPGQLSKTVVVPILADTTINVAKKFKLQLSAPVNCTLPGTGFNECIVSTNDGTTPPPLVAVDGPLILNGLITNAYNNESGRGGYFNSASGTSEGQSIMISAAFLAETALAGGTTSEVAASTFYHNLALSMLDAIGTGAVDGPLLRQPIPTDPTVITLLHWLFAARAAIPSQAVVLDFTATPSAGRLFIPVGNHGADVFRVWAIYPASSDLLYGSPYSPAFDRVAPSAETQVLITGTDWVIDGTNTVVITIPIGTPAQSSWKVIYGYNNAGTIPQGTAEEAYPVWTSLANGYASCAPDTFRWFDQALGHAITQDTRSGKSTNWTNLRAALRRSAVRGQKLTDKREIFRPWPPGPTGSGFAAIPASGDPSGMFAYSNHPAATPPADPTLNQQWLGYNFWSRDTNGDILGTVPTAGAVSQVQLGRGFNDSWRAAQAWQDPDQYLYIAVSCTKKPVLASSEHFYVYLSSTKAYSGTTRWYADIGAYTLFTATSQSAMNAGTVIEFLIPRTDFLRKDSDSAVLPVGTEFQNFGISAEMSGAYNIRLKSMRLVSGVSTSWVLANFSEAIKGGQLPFFPGAMPFNIAADTIKQQFVGYSGCPFHGYQLPDFWWNLGADAAAVHGTLTVLDLPTVDPSTGAVIHPMSLTTSGSVAKPGNALLMEQQVRFLQAAQNKYQADGGPLGPFAHTLVINTPDRINIGNPQPNTWVYTNDDPNTRWIGYQCRVVESLANLVLLAHTTTSFADVVAIAKTLVVNWLTWLNTAWPNLTGVSYTDPVTSVVKTIHGMPTEYPSPAASPNHPVAAYEEPHGPALILRACIHLKSVDNTNDTLCDALINRCWTYMETQFVTTTGEMQYTWSPDPTNLQWYGFWHGEIITAITTILANTAVLPSGFPASTARQRLVQTQGWLAGTGVQ